MGEYKKSNIIKYTREQLGLTQEYICESICDPVTMSRYENGVLNPSDVNFYRIMKRMGEYTNLIHIGIPKEFIVMEDVMNSVGTNMEKGEFDLALCEIENLKLINMKYEIPEIQQFCGRVEVIIAFIKGEIEAARAIDLLSCLLMKTDIDAAKSLSRQIYSEIELLIYYNIAVLHFESNNRDKSISMFKSLEQYILRSENLIASKPRYMVFLQYSNILGQVGEYKKSIAICQREIRWLYKKNKANYLYNFYYNIGWNIYRLNKDSLNNNSKKLALTYLWLAYKLCYFYPENKNNLKKIQGIINDISKE